MLVGRDVDETFGGPRAAFRCLEVRASRWWTLPSPCLSPFASRRSWRAGPAWPSPRGSGGTGRTWQCLRPSMPSRGSPEGAGSRPRTSRGKVRRTPTWHILLTPREPPRRPQVATPGSPPHQRPSSPIRDWFRELGKPMVILAVATAVAGAAWTVWKDRTQEQPVIAAEQIRACVKTHDLQQAHDEFWVKNFTDDRAQNGQLKPWANTRVVASCQWPPADTQTPRATARSGFCTRTDHRRVRPPAPARSIGSTHRVRHSN